MANISGNRTPQDNEVQVWPLALTAEESKEAKYLHPEAKVLFHKVPCLRCLPILGSVLQAFGLKTASSLGLVYILNKGVANNIIRYSLYPMYMRRFKVEPAVYQRMSSISSMGWSIKPLAAVLSDTIAIFGYTKRWYLVASCVLGAACALGYGLLPATNVSASIASGLVFVSNFCMANVDVLSEGHYSRLVRHHPRPGADLISWVWAMITLGQIIAAAIQGPISDSGNPQIGVFTSSALQLFCVIFFILNWFGEARNQVSRMEDYLFLTENNKQDKKTDNTAEGIHLENENVMIISQMDNYLRDDLVVDEEGNTQSITTLKEDNIPLLPLKTYCRGVFEINTEVITRNKRVVGYGTLMTLGVISMAVLTILGDTYQLLYGSIVVSVVLCAFGFYALPLTVAKANLFSYIQLASYILIPGALDTFYMADSHCLPDGPNFSQTFYNTIGGFIGSAAGIAGVYLFSALFSKSSYRLTFVVTTIILMLGGIFDLIIVERWNRPYVSDKLLFIIGDSVVYQLCVMLNYMPMNVLIARLCPKGSESTMFAILASFSNLGQATGGTIGVILMETVWPVRSEIPCDFSNVRWLVITGHLITPIICIPLVFLLIPSGRVCDALDVEEVFKKKETSNSSNSSSSSSTGGINESSNEPISAKLPLTEESNLHH